MPKKRNAYAWNPVYGWQLLRRNRAFQEEVARFNRATSRKKYSGFQSAYELLSKESSQRKKPYLDSLQVRTFGSVDGLSADLLFKFLDFDDPDYRKFLALYGDILLFPISPKTTRPALLNLVWMLRPSIPIDDYFSEWFKTITTREGSYFVPDNSRNRKARESAMKLRGNIVDMKFAVNTLFATSTIEDSLRESVKEFTRRFPNRIPITRTLMPSWSDFEFHLTLWDFKQEDGCTHSQALEKACRRHKKRFPSLDDINTFVGRKLKKVSSWISFFDRKIN